MVYKYTDPSGAIFRLSLGESRLERHFFKERGVSLLAIAWNRGADQRVVIDEVETDFPSVHFLTLMVNQSFRFEQPADVVLWQYNREFYCIVDHDQEVSCVGFLFYGVRGSLLLHADEAEQRSIDLLLKVFIEEFDYKDAIQGEMVRMLLKRLIIKLTRLAKEQYLDESTSQPTLDLIRQYSLLVELHYRELHQVRDYANLLHKSPKTLANLFALHGQPSPLQVIANRLALEGRRLLIYTDKTTGEIAYELGFAELAHFSRFFKKAVGQSPSRFKKAQKLLGSGSIDK